MKKQFLVNIALTLGVIVVVFSGCDTLFTSPPEAGESFDQPLEGLTPGQQFAFARGDEAFERQFSFREGLGPIFNQPACESCHPADGKSHPRTNLTRFGLIGTPFDPLLAFGGPQLQERSIPGVPPEVIPPQADAISVRSGPVVFGLGLLENIPDGTILANADPNDMNGDSISGKPNFVTPPGWVTGVPGPYGGRYLGRFGRKAGVAFLIQQVATAYSQDMGITSDFLPQENPHPQAGILGDDVPDPEVSTATVNDVVAYLRTLAPPKSGPKSPFIDRGEQIFSQVGCASCHVPTMRAGVHPTIAALSNVDVPLYSDLLLHDMGDGLEDKFVESDASGKEWRTTPLWGLRLLEQQLGGTAFYLHDGRTSDLREAIRLHGGEAQSARDRFLALPSGDGEALLAFLRSL